MWFDPKGQRAKCLLLEQMEDKSTVSYLSSSQAMLMRGSYVMLFFSCINHSLLPNLSMLPLKIYQVCRDFARGRCSRSANECRFLHHSAVQESAIVIFLSRY
jgi:hypothetical protein